MIITAIIQGKKENFVNLYLDDEFAAGITKNTLTEFLLFKDKFIDAETWASILDFDLVTRLYLRAVAYILIRPRSQAEIETYLVAKAQRSIALEENLRPVVNKVVSKLLDQKLINDEDFAKWWIDNRKAFRSRSTAELRRELQQKQIPSQIIDSILKQEITGDDQVELIRANARKKLRTDDLKFLKQDKKAYTKVTQYFMRRGFGYNLIKQALLEDEKSGD